ncbi:MAG: polymerase epsilon subunit (3-5 exonuclease) [Firmicutes bacterium]|nr:polymerase epsilon subunit (3-5 exonuclease) [Bacillota bacterium]
MVPNSSNSLPLNADFVAIDFETATRNNNSACALGLAFVKDSIIVANPSWLIRPPQLYFDPAFIPIHGIQPKDVLDQPTFAELWSSIEPYLNNQVLVAHNAQFDMNVLLGGLDHYRLPRPTLNYSCTLRIARRTWPTWKQYNLAALGARHGIVFQHHNAGEDATVCAQIALKAFSQYGVGNFDQLHEKLGFAYGKVFSEGHTPFGNLPLSIDFSGFGHWDISIHTQVEQKSRIERAKTLPELPLSVVAPTHISGYQVTLDQCSCPDFARRKLPCKHMYHLYLSSQQL